MSALMGEEESLGVGCTAFHDVIQLSISKAIDSTVNGASVNL